MFRFVRSAGVLAFLWMLSAVGGVDLSAEANNDYEENVAKLIFDFIANYKRLKFGIVFTCTRFSAMEPIKFYRIYKLLTSGNISFRAVNIDDYGASGGNNQEDGDVIIDEDNFAMLMRQLIAHHQFVLLDLGCSNARLVLEQASRYELFNASFHWLIIDKKLNNRDTTAAAETETMPASEPNRGARIHRLRGYSSHHKRNPTVDQPNNNCPSANSTRASCPMNGQHVTDGVLPEPGIQDDYYDAGPGDDDTFHRFETMNISINAEITLVKPTSASYRTFALFDIWNPGYISGGCLNVTVMGMYSFSGTIRTGQFEVRFRDSTILRRRNMRGIKLKIMTVVTQKPHEPFEIYVSTPKNTHLDSVNRYNFGMMNLLRDYFNFSLIMRRTNSWGYLRNGTFDGMIGALARREVDLGGSPMFLRQERHRVVSYTTRSFIERPCFIFRHPKRQNTMRNPFLLPFETAIWYLMTICGTILVVVLFISFYFEDSGFVRGAKSSIQPNNSASRPPLGTLIIEGDESYYEDSFHCSPRIEKLVMGPGQHSCQHGTKESVLFNDTYKNDNDDPQHCHRQPGHHHQWRRTPCRRHLLNVHHRHLQRQQQQQQQHHQRRDPLGGLATSNNSKNSNLEVVTAKAENNVDAAAVAGNSKTMQPTAHLARAGNVAAGGAQDARVNDSASSNYNAEKLSKSILLFLGGVCQQGLSEIPHLPSGKCTSLFMLLFGYLMFQFYSASIVGSLIMTPAKNVKTLRNLIDSGMQLGIEDIPYNHDYFVRTTDQDSLELYRTRVRVYDEKTHRNESHFLSAADGLKLVKAGGYAFHVAISAGYKIIQETFSELEVCELAEIDMFPRSAQWMVAIVQKNSPYRDVITYGLRRLNEAGIMDHQRHVWQEPKPKCVRKIAPTDLIVGMDSVYSAFILLLVGSLMSAGFLLIEILHHRLGLQRNRCHRCQQQKTREPRRQSEFGVLQRQQQQPRDHDLVYPYAD
ncbi:uncharacterized protein LOC131434178 [Malaya genurostris]|uniref:uncharacterized protein LOC131434178 n=1 Tax=Malaya genurostris TaxID=325434 RepID=UPI0026F3AA66|nr:uncharacterized protein LOC131434178 [Malaya genurostris]